MASSSFTNSTGWRCDVFLNFRGTDTRKNFTSHLHAALSRKGIHTFIDAGLERGKVIFSALPEIIESSRMSILIFSSNYASSTYCLDELEKILECQKLKEQIVVPIFYHVDPDEVKHQSGRYGEAFTRHESKEDMEKVKTWKAALTAASSFAGWPLENRNEADFIQEIVEDVHEKLNKKVQMESTPFNQLIPSQPNGLIKVRIARIWKTKHIGTGRIISVDCLLVNEKNEAIQGTMKRDVADHFGAKIQQGSVYEISNYFVCSNKSTYKVVDQTSMLRFAKKTGFKKVDDDAAIPLHKFNFIAYTDLNPRIDNHVLLTDLIGLLVAVWGIEHAYVGGKLTPMRKMIIQNLREEELPITLWGDLATEFDETAVKTMTPPVIIVLAAMTVKQFKTKMGVASSLSTMCFFNLDILEVQQYKSRFEGIAKHVQTLPSPDTLPLHPSERRNFNWKKISDIRKMIPHSHQGELFTCRATICNIDTTNGWWYATCPTCKSIVRKYGNEWWCDIDGPFGNTQIPCYRLCCTLRDDTGSLDVTIYGRQAKSMIGQSCWDLAISKEIADPKVLPPMINQIIGTTRIFQLSFGRKKAPNGKIDFVVSKILEDDQQPTIAAVSSSYLSQETEETLCIPSAVIFDKPSNKSSTKRKLFPPLPFLQAQQSSAKRMKEED